MNGISAAHKSLPFGTLVRVTNLYNGRTLDVRINDRGPFVRGRIIDLSKGAAERLDMVRAGVVKVEVRVIGHDPRPVRSENVRYRLQAGAFRDESRARKLAKRLRRDDPRFQVYGSDDGWFRVQARGLLNEEAADLEQTLSRRRIESIVEPEQATP